MIGPESAKDRPSLFHGYPLPLKRLLKNPPPALAAVLLSAALGQLFLAQAGQPLTLWPGLFVYGFALWKMGDLPAAPKEPRRFPPRTEIFLFTLLLALGLFLRVYQLDSTPAGLHTDQGLTGQCALRILHEGWRPFYE